MHSHDANGGMAGEFLLAPIKESACGSALCWLYHLPKLPNWVIFAIP
jgi:hypothetical protein